MGTRDDGRGTDNEMGRDTTEFILYQSSYCRAVELDISAPRMVHARRLPANLGSLATAFDYRLAVDTPADTHIRQI